jgi:DNA-binding CsgD family transcriptional regulator
LNRLTINIFCFFVFFWGFSQELPPLQNYSPDLYNAGSQNWDISQNSSGVIYAANNEGLLSYDGNHWRLYPSPNKSILRSVHVHNNIIYSGAYMDFGYWKPTQEGNLEYFSIAQDLGFKMLEEEQVWKISHYKQFIIFQSLNRLITYNQITNSINTLKPKNEVVIKSYFVDDDVYIQTNDFSIYKVSSDKLIKFVTGSQLNNNTVVEIFKRGDELLFLTDKDGFYRKQSNQIRRWIINSNFIFNKSLVYSATSIRNDYFVIGTVTRGLIILDAKGDIVYSLKKGNGLNNNTVLCSFIDLDENLWVGLDNGLAMVNLNSNNKFYFDYLGNLGSVYTSAIHNNKLYLGTNQGLFYRELYSQAPFKKIDRLQGQVWNLAKIDNTLFCSHNLGFFQINDNNITPLIKDLGSWKFSRIDKSRILVGTYNGLHVINKQNDKWEYKNKLKGFDISSRFIEISSKHSAIVSHGYKGLFNLQISKDYESITKVTTLPIETGPSDLCSMEGDIYYFNRGGLYKFDVDEEKFKLDSQITNLLAEDTFNAQRMISVSGDKLFLFGENYIYKLEKNIFSKQLELNRFFIGQQTRKDVIGFENITLIAKNNYLIGSREGYLLTNFSSPPKITNDIIISKVSSKNLLQQTKTLNINGINNVPYEFNTISFEFSLPEYKYNDQIKYRYILEGYNKSWSKWDNYDRVSFGNLGFGKYKLKLEARISDLEVVSIQREFNILKPWYANNIVIFIVVAIFIFIAFIINKAYERYYAKVQLRIIKENNQKLELIELRNKDKLIQLENKNLEENIESKNRELAIATMAILKKNQFLQTILNDLENMESNPVITRVLRLIKQKSKKTDDWEFFREAFDNSDKNFLKNIKSKHPKLTHNDLRLCAYLRLNLTSKEIAPLFNISPKSVEIKRYRLRKRMDLSRDVNLIDYILNL